MTRSQQAEQLVQFRKEARTIFKSHPKFEVTAINAYARRILEIQEMAARAREQNELSNKTTD
jgi:hypothetical protein